MLKNKIALSIVGTAAILVLTSSFVAADDNKSSGDKNNSENHNTANRMMVQINPAGRAQLSGTLAAVQTSSFTINSWGGVWTVNVSPDTKLGRRFGGKSSLSEFAAGDSVMINGAVNQSAAWTVDAKNVQNLSIQTRNANFYGTLSNLNGNSFSLATKERGSVNVTLNADAKILVNGKTGGATDLANGMNAIVNGVWDRTQSTVSANRVNARTPRVKPKPQENEGQDNHNASSTKEH